MAKSEHDADREQKPVVKQVPIEIKQGQKIGLLRRLVITANELSMQMSVRRWRPRRRPTRDPMEAVAKALWPPQGKPPETLSTGEALKLLGNELDRWGIPAGPDTLDSQRRAIGRR
jgi:hypothetical protein